MGAPTPTWGNYIFHGDFDVLAFAWLLQGNLWGPGYYHGTQAIEKYLKALALSIDDPMGTTHPTQTNRWIKDHNLSRLAARCASRYPYYGGVNVRTALARFSEFDQATRYPYVEQELGNGFGGDDRLLICELLIHLRSDIPIAVDDYPLGIFVRGHLHGQPDNLVVNAHWFAAAVAAARTVIPNLGRMVRW